MQCSLSLAPANLLSPFLANYICTKFLADSGTWHTFSFYRFCLCWWHSSIQVSHTSQVAWALNWQIFQDLVRMSASLEWLLCPFLAPDEDSTHDELGAHSRLLGNPAYALYHTHTNVYSLFSFIGWLSITPYYKVKNCLVISTFSI